MRSLRECTFTRGTDDWLSYRPEMIDATCYYTLIVCLHVQHRSRHGSCMNAPIRYRVLDSMCHDDRHGLYAACGT